MRFADILMAAATQGGGRDPDVAAYAAASGATGSYLDAVSVFISAEKASGTWYLTDDYWPLWAPNATQALTSLKQRRLATAVNSPTFTADRGYAFNGSSQYIDTGFIPGTHALVMSTSSVHAEVYELTNVSSSGASFGANSGAGRAIGINARNGTAATGSPNMTGGTFTLGTATSVGLTQTGRTGGALSDLYGAKNGVDLSPAAAATVLGASLPGHSIFIGAQNNSGAAGQYRAAEIGFVACGAALNAAQRLARSNNVQAMAAVVAGL